MALHELHRRTRLGQERPSVSSADDSKRSTSPSSRATTGASSSQSVRWYPTSTATLPATRVLGSCGRSIPTDGEHLVARVAAAHGLDAPGTDTEMVGNEFAEANVGLLGDRGGNDSNDETAIAPTLTSFVGYAGPPVPRDTRQLIPPGNDPRWPSLRHAPTKRHPSSASGYRVARRPLSPGRGCDRSQWCPPCAGTPTFSPPKAPPRLTRPAEGSVGPSPRRSLCGSEHPRRVRTPQ
jgi:hypothetical protein